MCHFIILSQYGGLDLLRLEWLYNWEPRTKVCLRLFFLLLLSDSCQIVATSLRSKLHIYGLVFMMSETWSIWLPIGCGLCLWHHEYDYLCLEFWSMKYWNWCWEGWWRALPLKNIWNKKSQQKFFMYVGMLWN